jgi:hypothetical protein
MIGLQQLMQGNVSLSTTILFVVIILWSLAWKGVALWKSARLYHTWWFVVLLVLNTVGILDIIYIFAVARKEEQKDAETLEEVEVLEVIEE